MNHTTAPQDHRTQFQGWASSPNRRGSFDTIWSCSITIILCSWSAVCINIPARSDNYWMMTKRKLWLTWICLTGPEFLMAIALGQWIAVKQSRKSFHASGYPEWTWKHGFYADMGGFVAFNAGQPDPPASRKVAAVLDQREANIRRCHQRKSSHRSACHRRWE